MKSKESHIDLIVRYLSGEITHDELIRLESWMDDRPANRKLFNDYKRVWESLGKVEDAAKIDVHKEWNILEGKLDFNSEGRMRKSVPANMRNLNYWSIRIAAVLVIALLLSITVISISRNAGFDSYITETTTLSAQLPDGSQFTLNTGSSLKYQKKFRNDQRIVKLTGEAYFEVDPDQARPFIVSTDQIEIKVLGTSFNVNAYRDNDNIEVIVNEGQVAVTKEGEITERLIIKPGNMGIFNKSDQSLKLFVNEDPNFLSWKSREFVFEDKSLEEIILTINKIYNSNIILTDDSIKEKRITVSFSNQSLEAILNVLSATLDLDVRQNNGEIFLTEKD